MRSLQGVLQAIEFSIMLCFATGEPLWQTKADAKQNFEKSNPRVNEK